DGLTDVACEWNITPVKSRNKQFGAVRIDETRQAYTNTLDRAFVSSDQSLSAINDRPRCLFGIGICFKLFLIQHSTGEVAGSNNCARRAEVNSNRYSVRCPQRK